MRYRRLDDSRIVYYTLCITALKNITLLFVGLNITWWGLNVKTSRPGPETPGPERQGPECHVICRLRSRWKRKLRRTESESLALESVVFTFLSILCRTNSRITRNTFSSELNPHKKWSAFQPSFCPWSWFLIFLSQKILFVCRYLRILEIWNKFIT